MTDKNQGIGAGDDSQSDANSAATVDGFAATLAGALDAATITQADLGQTIKQATPNVGVTIVEDGGAGLAATMAEQDKGGISLTDKTMGSQAAVGDVSLTGQTVADSGQGAADGNAQTFADNPAQAADKTAVLSGTQNASQTGQSAARSSGGSQMGGGSKFGTQQGRGSSLASIGQSQSISLRMADSSVSINIRPRNIAKSISGGNIKYEGQPASLDGSTDFELLEKLGEGGMGVVYSARQSSIDRPIALKMIKSSALNNPAVRAKFLQEAVVTGDLDHPNIVTVHDLGADSSGNVFYAMKKISGTEWSKAIKQKSQRENLDILYKVCDAIAFAHSRGIIHRDLKPENTMLGSFGEVLVMDWGLAVAANERGKAERVTAHTGISGTPSYMAPEMGSPDGWRDIGFCSDIYLLGAILYEIITGKAPHSGKNVGECLFNVVNNVIRPTEEKGELVDIALKAMAAKPADRYESVKDFQAAIDDYRSHSESIVLERQAREDLAKAGSTGDHEDYSKALFGFRKACDLWSGNELAHSGLIDTVNLYASAALRSGDLDLAYSLVSKDSFPECAEVRGQAEKAIALRNQQKRRNRLLRIGVIGLSAAVLFVSVVAAIWINAARLEANKRTVEAVAAKAEEQKQREVADKQRGIAVAKQKEAEQNLADRIAAEEREKQERSAKEVAQKESAENKAVIKDRDELASNQWWAFAPDQAPAKQKEIAEANKLSDKMVLDLGKGAQMVLVLIPSGTFGMGSPETEATRLSEEKLHRVRITEPFYMMQRELTMRQFISMGGKVGGDAQAFDSDGGELPAAGLSWDDVMQKIIPGLNKKPPAGWHFSMPTEAQWEWACRAGSNAEYYTGEGVEALRKAGFCGSDNLVGAVAVGKRQPNAWGLYDMHGNLSEWCADIYNKDFYASEAKIIDDPLCGDSKAGSKRVIRGGGWANTESQCRSAYRSFANPDSRYQFIGVRLVLVKDKQANAAPEAKDGK